MYQRQDSTIMKMNKNVTNTVLLSLFFTCGVSASMLSPNLPLKVVSSVVIQHDHASLHQEAHHHDASGRGISAATVGEKSVTVAPQQAGLNSLLAHSDSWSQLVWSAKGNILKVTNTGLSTLHLNTEIKLMPDNMPGTLEKPYILPGETLVVYGVCQHHLPSQTAVVIEAQAEDGSDMGSRMMAVER